MSVGSPAKLDFTTDDGFGARATLGVIVLETDRTIEAELRSIDLEGVAFHHSRIANDASVTRESLTAMEERLPVAAALLAPGFGFDAIGYGCTSAATLIGDSGVTTAIRTAHPSVPCTNPISAAIAALTALEVGRIAVVTPYRADVTAPIVAHFENHGVTVTSVASFLEEDDLIVARISEASVADAVRQVAATAECDAIFVSCTSLRTFGIIEQLESELARPVVSSNQALAWHLLRLGGVGDAIPELGRLFTCPGPIEGS